MLNICLCDNDVSDLKYYTNRMNKLLEKNNYIFRIESFKNGESLIFELEGNPNRFNIIIIDIEMKEINGIEVTKILRKNGYNGVIIFLTSHEEVELDSFKVEPLNYILKNDSDERVDNIFFEAIEQVNKISSKNIVISSKHNNKVINLNNIIYLESFNKKVILHETSGESEEINYIFKNLYEKIKNNGFIRCHKSYIVNINYVQTFNKFECKLQNDIIIPIGRKYSKDFRNNFLENEFDNIIL